MSSMKLYWDLASSNHEIRLTAANALIDNLKLGQEETDQEIVDEEEIAKTCSQDVNYAFKRLVRGLASARDDARLGFSMTLSELLKIMPRINVGLLWSIILKLTESQGSTKGQEERDIAIGRIFGIMAVVNSGLIKSNASLNDIQVLIDFLIKTFHSKIYLRIPAMEVILSLLDEIKELEIGSEGISFAILKCITTGEYIEEIWMVVKLQNQEIDYDWKTLLPDWHNGNPLHRKNIKKLVDILKDSTILNPALHPIWETLLPILKISKSKRISILELWDLFDQTLFTSTHERKCLGFALFQTLLITLSPEELVFIFSPNFLRCLMNNLSSKETYLHKIAKETAEQISLKSQDNSDAALKIVLQLIGPYGSLNFDSISKTKTVENILNNLTSEQVGNYIDHLLGLFMNQGNVKTVDNEKGPEVVRQRVLDQLQAIFKIQKIEKNETWIKHILKFLVLHGFFKSDKEIEMPVPSLTQKTQSYCRSKLESILGSLHSIIIQGYKERKYHGLMLNAKPWSRFIIDTVEDFKKIEGYSPLIEFDESVEIVFQKTTKLLKSIKKKKDALAEENAEPNKLMTQLTSFESLINHVLIQAYSDPNDLTSLIEDFDACFLNLWKTDGRSKKRKVSEETSIVPVDVLVDIFLSLLSKPSAPLRALILDIFKVFSSMISQKSLEIIFDVLKASSGPAGSEEIFEDNEDMDETSEEKENDEGVGEGESSESEDSDGDANLEMLEKDEEEDQGMNDDEMEEYDVKLAAIFKQRSLDQTQKKDMKKHTLHFKLRVVDLLEAFSQSQSQSPLILYLIENMVNLVLISNEKELNDRLNSALRKIVTRKEYPSASEVDMEKAESMLKHIHQLSGKISDSGFSNLCSLTSVFLVKVLSGAKQTDEPVGKRQKLEQSLSLEQNKENSSLSVVSQTYLDSFNNFITKSKSKLKPSLFLELFNRYPQYGWDILIKMVDLLGEEKIKSYNLVQGYNILASLIKLNKEITGRSEIIVSMAPKISQNLIGTLKSSSCIDNGPFQLNKERFRDLMKDLITLIRVSSRICSDKSLDWNHEELLSSINGFVEARKITDAKWMKNLLKELQNLIKQ